MVIQDGDVALRAAVADIQRISDNSPVGLRWTAAPTAEVTPTATSSPAPGLVLRVRADGIAHLTGEFLPPEILPSIHQEAVILHQLLNGNLVLHGSAVTIGGAAVATIGPSGAGKSTTAAALVRRGAALLADDVVALEDRGGELTVLTTESHLRLVPARTADGSDMKVATRPDGSDMKVATRPGGLVASPRSAASAESAPLAVVLVLTQDQSAPQPQWTQLHGLAALDALREYGAGPRGLAMLGPARFLQGLARVADGVDVWHLTRSAHEPGPDAIADRLTQIVQGRR